MVRSMFLREVRRFGMRATALVLLVGCADDPPSESPDRNAADSGIRGDARMPVADGAVRRDAGDAARPTPDSASSAVPGEGCASVSASAQARLLPVDIIWAIDTSGSMNASFPAIQEALNSFSQKVVAAGIDARIVLLAGAGLCVPAPLGSGQCGVSSGGLNGGGNLNGGTRPPAQPAPDSKDPSFLHLDTPFGYGDGIPMILTQYPGYRDRLRPNSHTHLVLTEDGPPSMSADAVVDQIEGRGTEAWQPGLAQGSWTFHGVVCKSGISGGACLLALQPPATTLELIQRSGGIAADLGLAGSGMDPFTALLDELAMRVIVGAELSCEYEIPPVPQGEAFNRDLVNVSASSVEGGARTWPQATAGSCADHQAWTYDDDEAPTKIVLCPAACDELRRETDARLDVQFGCQTITLL